MTVLQFKRPDRTPPKPANPLLYTVELSPHSTIFFDENDDHEVDKRHAADTLFDATFHVFDDIDDCRLLVMIGAERTDSMRAPNAFDTPAQRQWLARRLDDIYKQVTGTPRSRNPIRAFFSNLFPSSKD